MKKLATRPPLGTLRPSLTRDERGLSTVEYVVILVLIAVGAVSMWKKFGETIVGKVTSSDATIDGMGAKNPSK